MVVLRLTALAAVGFITAVTATPASAAVYSWTASFPTIGGSVSGSGTIVAQDAVTTVGGYTGHLATSMTGTYDGSAITSLLRVNSFAGNDNCQHFNGALGRERYFVHDRGERP